MVADLAYGLLPDHLVLALIVALMLLETLRVPGRVARSAYLVGMLAALAALLHQLAGGYAAVIVPGEVRVDLLSVVGKLVVVVCALVQVLAFRAENDFKFWLLAASSVLGAMVMLDSAGFVTLFLGIELLSLPAFALMVHGQGRGVASEGAFKYLLLSSVASALLLFGVSLAYGLTASLSIDALAQALPQGGAQARAAGLLVMCGLFLKAAVFPFHAWAPDAYASTRVQVTALLASVVKAAVVLALVRILGEVALDDATVSMVVLLALVSIYYGNVAALVQTGFKRLLAYSSIAHAGYMVFALVNSTGTRASDLLWYTAMYAAATLLACASFVVICPGEDDDLKGLDGQFEKHPVAATLLSIAVLSLAGMPPLPGFFAKLFIFESVIASGHLGAAVLAFVGSFLGLAYYLSIVIRLYRTDGRSSVAAST